MEINERFLEKVDTETLEKILKFLHTTKQSKFTYGELAYIIARLTVTIAAIKKMKEQVIKNGLRREEKDKDSVEP